MKLKLMISAFALGATLLSTGNAYAGDWAIYACGDDWGPVKQEAPAYPRRARDRGLEGYIVMSFDVSPEGKVQNITVKDANPSNAFVRSATNAVSSMEFTPCISNGIAVEVTDVSVKYDFNLN